MRQRANRATDILTAINSLPDEYVQCRNERHRLDPFDAAEIPRKAGWIEIHKCIRCGVERVRKLDRNGYIVSSHYDYSNAEGYRITGLGRLSRDDRSILRLGSLQDFIKHKG